VPAITVPKTRILTDPGYLYKAPIGSVLPGQRTQTITNKALTTNVVTLTTAATHSFVIGDSVTVALSPADPVFDGTYTVTGTPTGTTFTYAKTNANVTSAASAGSVSAAAGGLVAGSVFTDAWPAAWIPVGVTKEGHTLKYKPKVDSIEVAEYLDPLRWVTTSREISIEFEIAEFTAKNMALALNGGTVSTVSGTGATLLSKLIAPQTGAETRTMIGWESSDATERFIGYQCLQAGDVEVAHKKGSDNATIKVQFNLEIPAAGQPFEMYYAGLVAVGS
jgi:hypothetical protein